jgi:hypothetical protein
MRMASTAILVLCMAGVVSGCDRKASAPVIFPTPKPSSDLVEELARDPVRLKELRRLCVEERERVEEELCTASALAARKVFMAGSKPLSLPIPMFPRHPPP